MKKHFFLITLVLLMLCSLVLAETLSVGSSGNVVLSVKERLYELGYYKSNAKLSKSYTKDTAQKVKDFQQVNGLESTGELSDEEQALLFSDQAVAKPEQTPPPLATPAPTPVITYPERDEEGYLLSGKEWYYESPEENLWIALTENLQVTITKHTDSTEKLVWFETDIRFRGEEGMRSVQQKRFQRPQQIAENEGFILAFSDDFYGYRLAHQKKTGIIIRNGELISDQPGTKQTNHYPNLDMLVEYADGTLKACACNSSTAEELMAAGAVNTLSFGPILISGGELNREQLLSGHYSAHEPRQVLGMIEAGHYLLVTVAGRSKKSNGTDLWHIAGIMQERGVTEALNLDGGNTAALIFRGKLLNKEGNANAARTVNSLLGFGRKSSEKRITD